jgi:RNA polymerase sigma-70 factor, ECF subfamily
MKYSGLSAEELVKACAESQNAEAWEAFVRQFHKLIGSVVLRTAHRWGDTNRTLIDDLIQDTYLKICADNFRLLRDFKPEHPDAFFGMLKVTAANVVHDYFRARRSGKRGSGLAECELSEVEPFVSGGHISGAAQIERDLLLQQIDRVLTANLSPTAARDRDIFWLHHRQGFTAVEIARITSFGLTVKGVESVLSRLKRLVCQALVEQSAAVAAAPAVNPEGNRSQNPLAKGEGQT